MRRIFGFAAIIAGLLLSASNAQGAMTLTAAGMAKGFTLSTFVDQFPNNGAVGPVGIGFATNGNVIVSSYATGRNVVFSDVDGQHFSNGAISTSSYSTPTGIARVGSRLFQALQGPGVLVEIDNNGNFVANIQTGMPTATGVTANPANGHVFVSEPGAFGRVWDVNPVTNTKTQFLSSVFFDGMTISPDGSVLYGASLSQQAILGYNTTTGMLVFNSGAIPGGIDGSALGTGTLAGFIYVVTNGGTIVEVNLATKAQTIIATGGSRGDLVEVDPSNGTLLLTQTDRVLRLTPGAGGGFGGGPVPEPGTLLMFSAGAVFAAAATFRRRRG